MRQLISHKFVLALIVVLALLLRLPLLSGSFWLDEAAQALESARPLSQQLQIATDFQPPLLHLITWASIQFGHNESWLRLWGALIPALLTIILTFTIARKIADKSTAIIASLLLTTSSFHIFYSQELRPYAVSALWATLSWYSLIKLTGREKTSLTVSKKWLVAFIITTCLGLYTMYLYPLLLLSQIIWIVFFAAQHKKPLIGACLAGAITFLPWAPKFLQQLTVGQLLTQNVPNWSAVVGTPVVKSLPLTAGKFIFGVLDLQISWPYLIVTGLLILISSMSLFYVWQNKAKLNRENKKNLGLLLLWTLIPILIGWTVSWFIPVLQPKRVLLALPAFYMSISYIWFYLPTQDHWSLAKITKIVGSLGLILIIVINVFSTVSYWTNPQLQRENWRQLVHNLEQNYRPDSTMMVYTFDTAFAPMVWYQTITYPIIATGIKPLRSGVDNNRLTNHFNQDQKTYLVFDYLMDLSDPHRLIHQTLNSQGYQLTQLIPAGNIGFVREYRHE